MNEPDEQSSTSPMAPVSLSRLALGNFTGMLVILGAVATLYGPLLISLSRHFHISLAQAGILLSVHFVGALAGVPAGWFAMSRVKGSAVVTATLACFGLGALDVALAPSWPVFLVGVFVIGCGFGGLDFAINTLLARTAVSGRAHRLSVANAGYGLGAVLGPLIVVLVEPHNYRLLFGGAVVVVAILIAMNRGVVAPAQTDEDRLHELNSLHQRRRAILATFIVAYALYVAAESSASGWIAPQLHREGHSGSLASLITGGFWLGLTLGRVGGGRLHRHFADRALVLGSLGAGVVVAVLAINAAIAPVAYPLLGLAFASVYPMGLIWYTRLCPHDRNGLALIILCMMVGGIVGPGAESLAVSLAGVHAVPVMIAVFVTLDLVAFASASRFTPVGAHPRAQSGFAG
ncbi:MAG TPA: MFS transporter [Acidimicrobiales bacterium]|nr:MFS transporter [Acidimicrobiales bacterium]